MSRRPPSWRVWSEEEIALLREAWARGGLTEARKCLPDRSNTSLHLQAGRMGCSSPRQWTREEVEKLRIADAAGGLDAACAALPHRSRRSCADKLYRLAIDGRSGAVKPVLPARSSVVAAPPLSLAAFADGRRHMWTTQEIQLLRESWLRGGREAAVAALSHRSRSAVVTRGRQLKLRAAVAEQAWDRIDTEMLQRLYPKVGAVEAARRMTWRSPMAISQKALTLGMRVRRAAMPA